MSMDELTEILAAHADELNKSDTMHIEEFLKAYPDQRAELEPLLRVADQLKRTLKPVTPAPTFRARLHDGLMLAAHHQQTHRILIEKRPEPQWNWLLGAAALGSAAGVIAIVLRSRAQSGRPAAQPAAAHVR